MATIAARLALVLLVCLLAAPFDAFGAGGPATGKTRLFVLGTPHLSSMKDNFTPKLLDGLIERLAALNPDAILIEALPGPNIVSMEQQGGHFTEVLESYGKRMTEPGQRAQEILELSWAQAYGKVSDLNRGCPAGSTPETCILTFLAAYEYHTALLQFAGAPKTVQEAFRASHADLVEGFERSLASSNEYYTIALRLARQLEHQRLHPVDAHREKGPLLAMMAADPSIEKFFERVFGNVSEHPYLKNLNARKAEAVAAGDLLPYYRWVNAPGTVQGDFDFQWAPFLEQDDETGFGKARLALWEQRNLLMAANIARVLAEYPGGTAVYIVGSGHKPFIDGYFKTTDWVEVLEAQDVLGVKSE